MIDKNLDGVADKVSNGGIMTDSFDLTSDNVHVVQTLPNMINDLIQQLNSNHIQYDIYNLPVKNGGGLDFLLIPLQFIGFYLIATVVLNVVLNFFRGGGMGGGGMVG